MRWAYVDPLPRFRVEPTTESPTTWKGLSVHFTVGIDHGDFHVAFPWCAYDWFPIHLWMSLPTRFRSLMLINVY